MLAGHWVGLTCAACHTGQVNYHGTALLIEGGPAQNDIEIFRIRLAADEQRALIEYRKTP